MFDNEIKDKLISIRSQIDALMLAIDKDERDQDYIKTVILDYFGITKQEFESSERMWLSRVVPRDFYFFFGKSLLGLSLERLGAGAGNKDHATVLHGIKNIIKWLDGGDKEIVTRYEYLSSVFAAAGYDMSKIPDFIAEQKAKEKSSLKNLKK